MHTISFGFTTCVRSFTRGTRTARYLVTAMALTAAGFTAACGSDSATGPSAADVAGAYPMSAVRGFPVPHTFTDGAGSKLTIEGGSISIDATGSYALTYRGKLNALTFDLTDEGTYSLSGSTMTFDPEDAEDLPFTGRIQGSSVLVDDFKIAGVKFELQFAGN
jgi:hypothetical protein